MQFLHKKAWHTLLYVKTIQIKKWGGQIYVHFVNYNPNVSMMVWLQSWSPTIFERNFNDTLADSKGFALEFMHKSVHFFNLMKL